MYLHYRQVTGIAMLSERMLNAFGIKIFRRMLNAF